MSWVFAPRQFDPPTVCATPRCRQRFYGPEDAWAVPCLEDQHGCVLWYAFFCQVCITDRLITPPEVRAQSIDCATAPRPDRRWDRILHGRCGKTSWENAFTSDLLEYDAS